MSEESGKTRRIHEEHMEEEGEPWLVSYADLMTLLFGFFVLMYSFTAAKLDDSSDDWVKVKKELATYFGGSFAPNAAPADSSSKSKPELEKNEEAANYRANSGIELQNKNMKLSKSIKMDPQQEVDQLEKLQNTIAALEIRKLKLDLEKKLTPDQIAESAKSEVKPNGFEVAFSGIRLFPKGENSILLSAEGKEILKKLMQQLLTFNVPLKVTVECHRDIKYAPKPLTTKDEKNAFVKTTDRAVLVLFELQQSLNKEQKGRFQFGASGLGYLKSNESSFTNLPERVVIKVAVDEKEKFR